MNAEDYRLAALGDADAQVRVADYYDDYLRGEEDGPIDVSDEIAEKLIVEYLNSAADQGNADAQYKLSLLYYEGRYLGKDWDMARQWLRKAEEHGNAAAFCVIGRFYKEGTLLAQDADKAREYFELAIEKILIMEIT